jgi:class 3 adenylate cyclase/tetratricopeptide (TPR) repeat protein
MDARHSVTAQEVAPSRNSSTLAADLKTLYRPQALSAGGGSMLHAMPVSKPAAPSPDTPDPHCNALEEAIAALQARRTLLGDALTDAALAPLLAQLAAGNTALQPAAPARRLRQVSVLFLDLVGSTHLIQRLDPEEVQAVIDSALASFSAIVERHGGEVLRYAGDGLKAAFGARVTREDDAERAVLCGLELLQAAARAGDGDGAHLSARVGIHTGAAVRGGGVEQDNSLSGLAVNVAARMEQSAPAGGLRISQDTWALVRGVFDAEPQPALTVKGHDLPIQSWLVKAAKPRALRLPARGIAGLETPLVGREAECQSFDAAVQGLLADRQPRTLTLLAEAGLGKSRLLREFQHGLSAYSSRWWLLPARAQPSGALQPYGLLRDLLLRRLEIADTDSADLARTRFVQGLAPWLAQPNDPAPEVLGQLIGLDFSAAPAVVRLGTDARLLVDRALAALGLWLERLAGSDGSPVVLLLDDLHWADDASLDALCRLLRTLQAPVLALLGARPALLERRADWGEGLPRHQALTLQPLDTTQGAVLTQALLQRLGTVPAALATLVQQQSGGNPFYAEELVMLLIDQGAIERGEAEWTFHPERMAANRLPTTLTAVLQARIDALDVEQRRALQMASVIGPVFWDDALAALDPRGPAALPALQNKALVQPRPVSTVEHTVEETFAHHLLHQVSYGTVLKPERREAHARAAAWLTERVGARSDEFLAITAQHHERAGQAAQAAECYERASEKAFDRNAFQAALQYADSADAQQALAGYNWPPERFGPGMKRRIATCDALGLRDRQAETIDRLLAEGEAQGRIDWVASALADLTLLSYRRGRPAEAEAAAHRGIAAARAADDPVAGALCYGNLAWMAKERRALGMAQEHADAGLALAVLAAERKAKPVDGIYPVQLLLVRSEIERMRDNETAAKADLDRALALALAQQPSNPRLLCACYAAAAEMASNYGDLRQAMDHLDALERLAAEFGLRQSVAIAQGSRAYCHLQAGRWDDAVESAQTAIASCQAVAFMQYLPRLRAYLAEAHWRAGRTTEAVTAWEASLASHIEQGATAGALCTRLRLADARAASGRPDDVATGLQAVHAELPALAQMGVLSGAPFDLAGRLAAWRVLQRAGDAAAPAQLALAETELQQYLDGFNDEAARQRVAQDVPWHRDVLDALEQHRRSDGVGA